IPIVIKIVHAFVSLAGNGKIEFSEFIDMLSENFESKDKIQNDLREAFKVFDRDGNGFITASELRYTMTNLGEKMTDKEVDQMIDEADRNGDGRVDYNEFIEMIVQNRK
uniref:EF-hand domain-containing protein n=1 Tax=Biomphalaria glabrata TaxID=6526 RepID=A0A2C9K3E6_BIOGL